MSREILWVAVRVEPGPEMLSLSPQELSWKIELKVCFMWAGGGTGVDLAGAVGWAKSGVRSKLRSLL